MSTRTRHSGQGGLASERRSEAIAGYVLIAVPMILFLVLNIGQIFYALYISFFDWGTRGPREFLGVANYESLLRDPIFFRAITNTLYYAILVVPIQMALGLFLAVIVNQKIRGQTFFRAAFYFPAIASSAAITVLFLFIFAPDGLFNEVREALGLNPLFAALGFEPTHNWFGDSRTALNMIILLNAWTTSGTMMLFYLSFLQSIPGETYEAAAIDGAGWWQTFRRITFPLLAPAHFFVATVSVIGALQLFDQALIAGGPGGQPNNALTTIVLFLYRSAIAEFDFGYAAAVGIVLFVLIFSVTLVQRRLFGQAPSW
ncbi:MAG TPA: sugar ABC transporter permease [Candidatus Limnocylindrales bacterium]|nr:sugar ABC transporter permease [Candidatus Limnocylindrales bacterium]